MNRAHEIMCSSSNVRLTISYTLIFTHQYLLLFFMEEKNTFQPIKLKKVFTSPIFLKSQRSGEVVKKKKKKIPNNDLIIAPATCRIS